MRLALAAILLATVVAADPYPWAAPEANLAPKPKHAHNKTSNRTHHNHHHEPTPTFKQGCDCTKPIVPINLLNEKEKCLMQHANDLACYLSSKGGCPSPAPACGLAARDIIPLTH